MSGLWLKRGVYYGRVVLPGGEARQLSLRTKDRDEAVARKRELELTGDADWLPRRRRARSVAAAASAFLRSVVHSCATSTTDMYRQKAANVCRILGERSTALFKRTWTIEFIEARLDEGAQRHTIAKELSALRGILSEAMAQGWLRPVPIRLLVPRFKSGYVPRTSAPTPAQASLLLGQLEPKRQTWVLLALSGLRTSEVDRVAATMLTPAAILVPGTKTHGSRRVIPRPSFLAGIEIGASGRLVERWSNVRRDLARACKRAGIPTFTPTDLRRAYATWLRAAQVSTDVIAKLLGHAPGSAVTEAVYAQVPPRELVEATQRLPPLIESEPEWLASTASALGARTTPGTTTPSASESRSARVQRTAAPQRTSPAPPNEAIQ